MAEVVGIVASSVTIGELVMNLRNKYRSFRNASHEIESLLDESTHVNNMLSLIQRQQTEIEDFVRPTVEWESCHRYCQKTAEELTAFLEGLKRRLDRDRWRGSLQCMFKEGEINRQRQKLDRAKSSLLLAQSSLNSYV